MSTVPEELSKAILRYNAAAKAYERRRSTLTVAELDAAGDHLAAMQAKYGAVMHFVADGRSRLAMLDSVGVAA